MASPGGQNTAEKRLGGARARRLEGEATFLRRANAACCTASFNRGLMNATCGQTLPAPYPPTPRPHHTIKQTSSTNTPLPSSLLPSRPRCAPPCPRCTSSASTCRTAPWRAAWWPQPPPPSGTAWTRCRGTSARSSASSPSTGGLTRGPFLRRVAQRGQGSGAGRGLGCGCRQRWLGNVGRTACGSMLLLSPPPPVLAGACAGAGAGAVTSNPPSTAQPGPRMLEGPCTWRATLRLRLASPRLRGTPARRLILSMAVEAQESPEEAASVEAHFCFGGICVRCSSFRGRRPDQPSVSHLCAAEQRALRLWTP